MKRANVIMIILVGIFSVLFVPALFSQESNEGKASELTKDKVDIKSDAIEKSIPSYRMRLKDILKEAEENIKKVDKELNAEAAVIRNQEREAKVAAAFERGNQLYKEGKLKEAKEEWNNALTISKDPEMRGYIEEASRKANEEDRRLQAEAREKARLEKEAARKAESEARESARQAKLEAQKQARIESDRLEAIRIESEKKAREEARQLEAAARERASLEREAARKAEAEQREKARLERESARKLEAAAQERARLEKEAARKAKEAQAKLEREAAKKAKANK